MASVKTQTAVVSGRHLVQFRRAWLEMMAASPGAFEEALDEAMALDDAQWSRRLMELTTGGARMYAALDERGNFGAFVAGYLDGDGDELTAQISYLHVERGRDELALAAAARLAEGLREKGVTQVYAGVPENRPVAEALLRCLGFEPTGHHRPIEVDSDLYEIEYVHNL